MALSAGRHHLLVAGKVMPSIVADFLPCGSPPLLTSHTESGTGARLRTFAEQLMPAVDARFRTRADRDHRANVGMDR